MCACTSITRRASAFWRIRSEMPGLIFQLAHVHMQTCGARRRTRSYRPSLSRAQGAANPPTHKLTHTQACTHAHTHARTHTHGRAHTHTQGQRHPKIMSVAIHYLFSQAVHNSAVGREFSLYWSAVGREFSLYGRRFSFDPHGYPCVQESPFDKINRRFKITIVSFIQKTYQDQVSNSQLQD